MAKCDKFSISITVHYKIFNSNLKLWNDIQQCENFISKFNPLGLTEIFK